MKPDAFADLLKRWKDAIQTPVATDASKVVQAQIGRRSGVLLGPLNQVHGEPILRAKIGEHTLVVGAQTSDSIRLGFDLWASSGVVLCDGVALPEASRRLDCANPTIDEVEGQLLHALSPGYGPLHSPWPRSAPFALGLSHDVDRTRKTFQHVTHPLRELSRGHPARALTLARYLNPRAYWCFDRVEALERRNRVTSTFFFLHDRRGSEREGLRQRVLRSGATRLDNPEVANTVVHLRDAGWEIGLHSSTQSMSSATRLVEEKRTIERILREPVGGVRQHFLSPVVSELWGPQEAAGFQYDASMGFADRVGFRSGSCFPYFIGEASPFCEVPFQIMDRALESVPSPQNASTSLIDKVANVGGTLGLLWHQRFFNETEFPGFSDLYEDIVRECKRRGAWIAPLGKIVKWWQGGPSED